MAVELSLKVETLSLNQEDEGNFDEFIIDDTLEPLERIRVYIRGQVVQRLYTVRELAESVREIGHPSVEENVLPLLDEIKGDPEPAIRQALVEQIPELFRFLKEGGESSYKLAVENLIPIAAGYTVDSNSQVRQAAMESFVELGPLVTPQDLNDKFLPIIKNLVTDATEEEHRVQAAQLMNDLAPLFGASLCEEFVIPNITVLASDPMFRVRKAVASNIGNICTTIGVEKTTKYLLPLFVKLASDEIWGVRKACAESLVILSQNLNANERNKTLVPVFENLAEDMSRWVRNAAFQILGPFIATFPSSDVTPKLLSYYKSMAEEIGHDSKFGDSDNVYYCAFNFPAVLHTLGRERWPELNDLYDHLVKDLQWKVRRTLSFSLHEVAKILGTELTEKCLLSTFELFFKDLEEVKIGIVTNLAKFLQILSPKKREQYLYILSEVQKDALNWRFRKLLAKQMGDLSCLFLEPYVPQQPSHNFNNSSTQPSCHNNNDNNNSNNTSLVSIFNVPSSQEDSRVGENDPFNVVLSVTTTLLYDPVASVRQTLLHQLPKILQVLENFPQKKQLFEELKKLPFHSNYQFRQMFGTVCLLVLDTLNPNIFENEFLPLLVTKYNDKVPNVRLTFAKALRKVQEHAKYSQNVQVNEALTVLQHDKDRDVIDSAGGKPPPRIKNPSPVHSHSIGSINEFNSWNSNDILALKNIPAAKENLSLSSPLSLGFTLTIPQNKVKNHMTSLTTLQLNNDGVSHSNTLNENMREDVTVQQKDTESKSDSNVTPKENARQDEEI